MEIGKINIDFQVLRTYDPKVILIADTSQWKHIIDAPSVIEITLPGSSVPYNFVFDKEKINILNSSIIGITCKACSQNDLIDLPDGIYKIKVKGSPDTFFRERYYLRTDKIQLEIDKLYASVGIDFDPSKQEFRDLLLEIDMMIKASESSIRLGDINKASMYFKCARTSLMNFNECKDCFDNE